MPMTPLRATLAGAVCALALTSTAALAQQHDILVMPDAYFPAITHVDPGDTVLFVNTTETVQNIVAAGEAWTLGPIPVSGEMLLTITEGQETDYFNAGTLNAENATYGVSGFLSFEDPPID